MIIDAYLKGTGLPALDYSKIREKGTPIKTFGGVCPGPEPLKDLHKALSPFLNMFVADYPVKFPAFTPPQKGTSPS